jgi:serine-type D-Ala-D-Ala carboxypeptidase/endopeptidase (penicillin-binding protein 4)
LLELFSSGLVAVWLQQVGLPATLNPFEPAHQVVWQSSAGMVWPSAADPSAEQTLQQYLRQLAGEGLNLAEQGIWLQSGATVLASQQGTVALPAASLTKVVITLAALKTWSPEQQFTTIVNTTGTRQNGVVQGDLVIQGGGDPLFGWATAIDLGQRLNQLGITRVTGDLVIADGFVMNFQVDPLTSGKLLKQALNAPDWTGPIAAQYAKLPAGALRPQVVINGQVRKAAVPSTHTELLRLPSLPLRQLLRKMNVHSNNVMAQMLTDRLGGHAIARQTAAAAAGVGPEEIQLINGSGLGVENRISARAVCTMFEAIDRLADRHNLTLADLFPSSGFDQGTLEDRHIPTTSVVKTGTLSTVSALAGVLPTRDRGLVWFTIINRGGDIIALRNQQDGFLQQLQQQWGKPNDPGGMLRPQAGMQPEGDVVEFNEP